MTPARREALKEDAEMEFQAGLHASDDIHSARPRVAETKVVARLPDNGLTEVKKLHIDMGSDSQLVRVEGKKNIAEEQGGAHRGETKQQRLQPRKNTLSQGQKKKRCSSVSTGAPQKQSKGT